LKGETFHQLTTGTSGVPGRPDVDTRSKYSNPGTIVGEPGLVIVLVDSTDDDDRCDIGRGEARGIGAIVTSCKGFIYRQVWEVVGNDVLVQTTCTRLLVSYKRSGDVGEIDQEPVPAQ